MTILQAEILHIVVAEDYLDPARHCAFVVG